MRFNKFFESFLRVYLINLLSLLLLNKLYSKIKPLIYLIVYFYIKVIYYLSLNFILNFYIVLNFNVIYNIITFYVLF